jgi:hypothetical protein
MAKPKKVPKPVYCVEVAWGRPLNWQPSGNEGIRGRRLFASRKAALLAAAGVGGAIGGDHCRLVRAVGGRADSHHGHVGGKKTYTFLVKNGLRTAALKKV